MRATRKCASGQILSAGQGLRTAELVHCTYDYETGDTAAANTKSNAIQGCNECECAFECLAFKCLAFECLAFECLAFKCLAFKCLAFECLAFKCLAFECLAFKCLALESLAF